MMEIRDIGCLKVCSFIVGISYLKFYVVSCKMSDYLKFIFLIFYFYYVNDIFFIFMEDLKRKG